MLSILKYCKEVFNHNNYLFKKSNTKIIKSMTTNPGLLYNEK